MILRIPIIHCFTAVILLVLALPQRSIGQGTRDSISVYGIMDKALEARGGREFLQSIQSISTVTKTITNGIELSWIAKEMLPNKASFQIAQNNRLVYHSWYDGSNGFEIVKGVKKKQLPWENKDRAYKKNLFPELDYINPSLWKLALVGEENVLNEDCYKIKATLLNGSVKYLFYNKRSFLLIMEENSMEPQAHVFSNFIYLSYKKFGKLVYPHQIKYGEAGKLKDAVITEVHINEGVEEKDFR
jgi:hypothetical protein